MKVTQVSKAIKMSNQNRFEKHKKSLPFLTVFVKSLHSITKIYNIIKMPKDRITVKNYYYWKDKEMNLDRQVVTRSIFTSLWPTLMMSPKYLMAGLNRSCMSQQKKMVVAGERLPNVVIWKKEKTNNLPKMLFIPDKMHT